MKGNEFHNMTDVELAEKLKELKSELFNLRFRHASGVNTEIRARELKAKA